MMIVLNFSHPFTAEQQQQIEETLDISEPPIYYDSQVVLDVKESFPDQIRNLVNSIGLTSHEWQTEPILINPPALNFAAITLLAELHGRMGYFPTIIRIRPVPDAAPQRYELAEMINLQAVREFARQERE
jgi:hypothetical protein